MAAPETGSRELTSFPSANSASFLVQSNWRGVRPRSGSSKDSSSLPGLNEGEVSSSGLAPWFSSSSHIFTCSLEGFIRTTTWRGVKRPSWRDGHSLIQSCGSTIHRNGHILAAGSGNRGLLRMRVAVWPSRDLWNTRPDEERAWERPPNSGLLLVSAIARWSCLWEPLWKRIGTVWSVSETVNPGRAPAIGSRNLRVNRCRTFLASSAFGVSAPSQMRRDLRRWALRCQVEEVPILFRWFGDALQVLFSLVRF